jgi:hypothetical protein
MVAAIAVAAALVVPVPALEGRHAGAAVALPSPVDCDPCWTPSRGPTWQWQLSGPIDTAVRADVYDTDLFDTPPTTIRALHLRGKKTVCYVSAGTWEGWRPDANRFPRRLLGKRGWPGERWLDIRQLNLLEPILASRLDACKAKGFDGVEFDNVDAYANASGFRISPLDQLRYNTWLANHAHRRGLAAVLKNDLDQARALLPYFDAILVEQCLALHECAKVEPFTRAGKPAIGVEYRTPGTAKCQTAAKLGIQVLQKRWDLTAPTRRPCAGS